MVVEEEFERGKWSGKLDFLLSAIGYAVGIGNVWRFPYLAYSNGGASFLFPYIIMLIIAGLPLFLVELAIGQFTSQGPITCWQMAPFFVGIGYAMVFISAIVSLYYNMIIAYALYYMLVSFVSLDEGLPWEKCNNVWMADNCRTKPLPRISEIKNTTDQMTTLYSELYNENCIKERVNMTTWEDYNSTTGLSEGYQKLMTGFMNKFDGTMHFDTLTPMEISEYSGFLDCRKSYITPAAEYYTKIVMNEENNTSLNDLGSISLKLAFTLFASWVLIFACLMKGIKTSGKVVYFTATFPYIVLVALLIRGVTLEGHLEGVKFYVIPEWEKLADATIWHRAATQIFYSLGIGFGGLLTMSSYNKFNNNCYRDAILVSVINCGTSIFAGFAIFSLLGHMAFLTNKEVKDVATSGTGLAFIVYPDGISRLPAAPLMAFLFFFMLVTLGMDSQFAMMETIISSVSDVFPRVLRKWKTTFTFILCMIGFLLGLPLCTEGGNRLLTLMFDYTGSYNLMIIALAEVVCVCYVYGINRFREDISMMVGFKPGPYWVVTWCFLTPVAVVFIVIVSAIGYVPTSHNDKVIEPWAEAIGWLMILVPIALIVILAIIQVCRLGLINSLTPQANWGPDRYENKVGRYRMPGAEEMGTIERNGNILPEKSGGFDNPSMINERL